MSAQYFAQLDENKKVINIHAVTSEYMSENPDRYTGTWVETFIDDSNKIYAGVGYIYDEATQDFVAPPSPEPVEPLNEP